MRQPSDPRTEAGRMELTGHQIRRGDWKKGETEVKDIFKGADLNYLTLDVKHRWAIRQQNNAPWPHPPWVDMTSHF